MYILAFIGLIAILAIITKSLMFLGNLFETLSQKLSDRTVSQLPVSRQVFKNSKEIREKINIIKGNGTDKQFWDSVQKDINRLCN